MNELFSSHSANLAVTMFTISCFQFEYLTAVLSAIYVDLHEFV